ncbi:MAG: FAD-binding protein, partial [Chloroflexaceae bacterium]|nr:FAD-binding protein [Chloroflexaceae bacterium]
MTISTLPDIQIEPGALLATAPADTTLEALNEALVPFGLCLPIAPLRPGLTLAEAIRQNAGGRRQWRYGTIVRYLRAATLVSEDGLKAPLVVGGSTLKRATGYGLNRALVAGGLPPPYRLADVTLSLRPLPPARRALLLACPSLAVATAFAAALLPQGLALSALAVQTGDGRPNQNAETQRRRDAEDTQSPIANPPALRPPLSLSKGLSKGQSS